MESQIDEEYATDQPLTVVLMKVILDKAISQRRKNSIKSQNLTKNTVARSQLQAMSQLASGVNKLADVNAKWLQIKEEDCKALLQFKKKNVKINDTEIHSVHRSPFLQGSWAFNQIFKKEGKRGWQDLNV